MEIALHPVAARPAPSAEVVLPHRMVQAHQVAELVRQGAAGTAPDHGGVPAGERLQFLRAEVPAATVGTHRRPTAGTYIRRARAEHDGDIGRVPFRLQPHRRHIHPARRILLVLDFHRHRAHHPKAQVDPAAVHDFVGDGEQVGNPGGGIAVLLRVAGAVEHHHIDGGSTRRGPGVFGIRAPQLFVGVGHAVAIRVLQIVEIVHAEPGGRVHRRLHQRPVLLLPVVAFELLKHELKRAFPGNTHLEARRRGRPWQPSVGRHRLRDVDNTEPIVVPALLGMPPPSNDDAQR